MSEFVCSSCGEDGIYEVLEVHGSASRNITIEVKDGKPFVGSKGFVEMDYNTEYVPDGYACSECQERFVSLKEAVTPAERRYECLDCNLWAFYRRPVSRCLDCGSERLREVGAKQLIEAQKRLLEAA